MSSDKRKAYHRSIRFIQEHYGAQGTRDSIILNREGCPSEHSREVRGLLNHGLAVRERRSAGVTFGGIPRRVTHLKLTEKGKALLGARHRAQKILSSGHYWKLEKLFPKERL